jgi:hypothetical protein
MRGEQRKKIREIKFGNYTRSKLAALLAQGALLRQYIGAGIPIFDSKCCNLVFSFFLFYNAHCLYWRTESFCVTRRCAANTEKKIREIKFGNNIRSKLGRRCLWAQGALLRQYIGAGIPIFDSYLAFLNQI